MRKYTIILIILMIILIIPVIIRSEIRRYDKNQLNLSNLKQIGMIMMAYASENNGSYPRSFEDAIKWSDGEIFLFLNKCFDDYRLDLEYSQVRQTDGSNVIFIYDNKSKNALFADGHVAKINDTSNMRKK